MSVSVSGAAVAGAGAEAVDGVWPASISVAEAAPGGGPGAVSVSTTAAGPWSGAACSAAANVGLSVLGKTWVGLRLGWGWGIALRMGLGLGLRSAPEIGAVRPDSHASTSPQISRRSST